MKASVTDISIEKWNEEGVPELVKLKFSSGKRVVYSFVKDREVYFTKPTNLDLEEFHPPNFDACIAEVDEIASKDAASRIKAQLKALEDVYSEAMEGAESLYFKNVEKLRTVYEERTTICDRLFNNQSATMSEEYRAKKEQLFKELRDEIRKEEKLYWMSTLLRDSKKEAMVEAANLLHKNSEYLIERLANENSMWTAFLSHVQEDMCEVSGMIKESLVENDVSVITFDGEEDEESLGHCVIDCLVDSSVFIMVLSNSFFTSPYCIYQYCVAQVIGRPIVAIADHISENSDDGEEGLSLSPKFLQMLESEPVKLRRDNWNGFITILEQRVRAAENGEEMLEETDAAVVSDFVSGDNLPCDDNPVEKTAVSVEQVSEDDDMEDAWNENTKTNEIHIQDTQVIHIGKSDEWQTVLGNNILRTGKCRLTIELKKGDRVSVGVIPLGGLQPQDGDEFGEVGG